MTAALRSEQIDEFAWMIGEEERPTGLSLQALHLRETRILAAIFRRRFRLIIAWRRQAQERPRWPASPGQPVVELLPTQNRSRVAGGELTIVTDLPRHLPPLREEIAIWRSFLSHSIHAILFESD